MASSVYLGHNSTAPELADVDVERAAAPLRPVPPLSSQDSFRSSNKDGKSSRSGTVLQLVPPARPLGGLVARSTRGPIEVEDAHITALCMDYDKEHLSLCDSLDYSNLQAFLQGPRPPQSKVRWLNIKGVSRNVLDILKEKYQLHPLAYEDVLNDSKRIKADFFDNHLYVSMTLVALNVAPKAEEEQVCQAPLRNLQRRMSSTARGNSAEDPDVYDEQVNLFLLPENTLLTVSAKDGAQSVTDAISKYLETRGTQLRESEDASFLLHQVISHMVDHASPVVAYFEKQLILMEEQIKQRGPRKRYTDDLHEMTTKLNRIKKSLVPTQYLIHTLRTKGKFDSPFHKTLSSDNFTAECEVAPMTQHRQWLSKLARVYLSDVNDHVATLSDSIDALQVHAKDLSALVFNTISFHSTRAMQMLSVTSFIFLPLTFIAGVYGTNFTNLPELSWHLGYMYFWLLCAGLATACIVLIRMVGWARDR